MISAVIVITISECFSHNGSCNSLYREGSLVCSVAGVFAGGLVQNWLPQVDASSAVSTDPPTKKGASGRTGLYRVHSFII